MAVAKRGTLLIMSGPSHDPGREHLHVVCSDPDHEGKLVIVNLCSKVDGLPHDNTTILQSYEHDWLKRESYVFYAKARIETDAVLAKGLADGLMTSQAIMNVNAFLKVKNGICRSPHTPRKVKNFMGCPSEQESELEVA